MTDDQLAGFGAPSWLPPRIQRAQAEEARRDARAERDAAAEREARREAKHEAALALYRSQAEERGDHVSAMALAQGRDVGRPFADIFEAAREAADVTDAREAGRRAREARGGDPEHAFVGEPSIGRAEIVNEYELSRTLREIEDSRSWMAGYQMRQAARRGEAAAHIEAKRRQAERAHESGVRRDRPTSYLTARAEISR
jgi:hypothetical protein